MFVSLTERWGHGWFYHLYLIRAVSWLCATLPLVINTQTESVQSFIFCFCSARGCIQIKTETFNNTIQQLSEGTVTVQHCCTCCASDWGPLPSEKDRSVYITDHGWTSPEGNLSTQVFFFNCSLFSNELDCNVKPLHFTQCQSLNAN